MYNSWTKAVIEKSEEVYEQIDVQNDKHPFVKAFGCGAIQGAIDAAVLMYLPLMIGVAYWKHKALKK